MSFTELKKKRQEYYDLHYDGMNPKSILKRINIALEGQLYATLYESVGDYVLWFGVDRVAETMNMPENHIMSLFSFKGFPTMVDMLKVFKAMDLEFIVAPICKVDMR